VDNVKNILLIRQEQVPEIRGQKHPVLVQEPQSQVQKAELLPLTASAAGRNREQSDGLLLKPRLD
jgi:hypothetical protein